MRNSLKDMMARRGLTAQDVATALGCHRETVYRWMQNRTRISEKYETKLFDFLHCDFEDLFHVHKNDDRVMVHALREIVGDLQNMRTE